MRQAVGMSQAGFTNRKVAGQIEAQHSVTDRLMQRLQATAMVDERPRSVSARKSTHREYRLIARRNRFSTSARIRDEWNFVGHVFLRAINRRLSEQRQRDKRPIKRPQLSIRHLQAR